MRTITPWIIFHPLVFIALFMLGASTALAKTMRFEELPKEIQEKIAPGIGSVFSMDKTDIRFSALAGGLSGTPIYKVEILGDDKAYVARVLSNDPLSARKIVYLSWLATNNNFGPKVYYPKSQQAIASLLIIDLAPGSSPKLDAFSSYQQQLAKTVRMLHNTTFDGLPRSNGLVTRIYFHLKKLPAIEPYIKDILIVEKIENTLLMHTKQYGFTHQDLNPGNILYEREKLYII